MPNSPRNPNEEFLQGPRIPSASRWDLDAISEDSESLGGPKGLGHMMPSPQKFAEACCTSARVIARVYVASLMSPLICLAARGIKPSDHVVLYDSIGIFSAPRGWYTFKVSLWLSS
jgi:thiosulfate/3-mercaptopyruvate sulfurtransferase